jgi:predicted dehydrogenase
VYGSIAEMVQEQKSESVAAFGIITEHLKVVQFYAPSGIHVMVEKPLSISMAEAKQMQQLDEQHKI